MVARILMINKAELGLTTLEKWAPDTGWHETEAQNKYK